MTTPTSPKRFISLKTKIWIGFTLIFTPVFLGSYYWFYHYTTSRVLRGVTDNLENTINGAARGINPNNFLELYRQESQNNPQCPPPENAPPEENGYYPEDNSLYWEHVTWLRTIQELEPRMRAYTYIQGSQPGEIIAIGSTGVFRKPRGGFRFCQRYQSDNTRIYDGLFEQVNVWDIYKDDFGYWITTYMPIRDHNGEEMIGAIGIDIPADYVETVRRGILVSSSIAFLITYVGIFLLIYTASNILTRPLMDLTEAAEQIGEGNYKQNLTKIKAESTYEDEIGTLIRVFQIMVGKVAQRERTLRQEISELRIEIDEAKRKKQVAEIVDSDAFKSIQDRAQEMRAAMRRWQSPSAGAPSLTHQDTAAQSQSDAASDAESTSPTADPPESGT